MSFVTGDGLRRPTALMSAHTELPAAICFTFIRAEDKHYTSVNDLVLQNIIYRSV